MKDYMFLSCNNLEGSSWFELILLGSESAFVTLEGAEDPVLVLQSRTTPPPTITNPPSFPSVAVFNISTDIPLYEKYPVLD